MVLDVHFSDKQKIRRTLILLGIAIVFTFPLELFHLLLESLHILFEWAEVSLDFVIETMFDTSLHKTQIVVFYVLIALFFYGFYRLWKAVPRFYQHNKEELARFISDETVDITVYWHGSMVNKIKLVSVAAGLIFLLLL